MKAAKCILVRIQDRLPSNMEPAERHLIGQHVISDADLKHQEQQSRFSDKTFLKSEFASLVEVSSLHGRMDVDLFACGSGPRYGHSMSLFCTGTRIVS